MRSKEYNITLTTIIFLLSSLVFGGASAIITQGILYDIFYAIHKVTSVIMTICIIILIKYRGME